MANRWSGRSAVWQAECLLAPQVGAMTEKNCDPGISSEQRIATFKGYARRALMPPFRGPPPLLVNAIRHNAVVAYVADTFKRTGHLPRGCHQVQVPRASSQGPAWYNIPAHTIEVVFPDHDDQPRPP